MNFRIRHNTFTGRFTTEVSGYTAILEYSIHNGIFDVIYTKVPKPLNGRGIASALVRAAYEFAMSEHYKFAATASYAISWLNKNHPNQKVRN